MATVTATQPTSFLALSRTMVAAAAEFVAGVERRVVGEDNVRTARGNAWAAIQADRARAQARDDMDALVRALLTNGPRPAATAHATSADATSAATLATTAATRATAAAARTTRSAARRAASTPRVAASAQR